MGIRSVRKSPMSSTWQAQRISSPTMTSSGSSSRARSAPSIVPWSVTTIRSRPTSRSRDTRSAGDVWPSCEDLETSGSRLRDAHASRAQANDTDCKVWSAVRAFRTSGRAAGRGRAVTPSFGALAADFQAVARVDPGRRQLVPIHDLPRGYRVATRDQPKRIARAHGDRDRTVRRGGLTRPVRRRLTRPARRRRGLARARSLLRL